MKTIQENWQLFLALAVPADAPDVQKRETKIAFYAGCQAMFQINVDIASPNVSEAQGIKALEKCAEELRAFGESLKNSRD